MRKSWAAAYVLLCVSLGSVSAWAYAPRAEVSTGMVQAAPATPPAAEASPGFWERVRSVFSDDALDIAKRVLLGLLIFIVGWIAAKFLAWAVYRLMGRATKKSKLGEKLGIDKLVDKKGKGEGIEYVVSRIVYYVLMLLVVVGVLQYAKLTQAAEPIQNFVDTVMRSIPLVGKAALVLAIAYLVALVLRKLVTRGLDAVKVDERFAEMTTPTKGAKKKDERPFSETVGQVVFWLVMVGGLAGALESLDIQTLSEPLQNVINKVMSILPALGVAVLIVLGGYVLGRIARTVVRNLLESAGFDRLVEKIRLQRVFSKVAASDVLGIVVMVFILVQAGIAALDQLELTTLSKPLNDMVSKFWDILPALFIAVLIVAVGEVVGRLDRNMVVGVLQNFKFDEFMHKLGFGHIKVGEEERHPSEVLGWLTQIWIVLIATAQALEYISADTWAGYVTRFLDYATQNVAVALIVVAVGFAVGNYVREFILSRRVVDSEESLKWISELARYTILVFAFTMAIHQLDVAEGFVLLAFGLLFGGLCLAFSLALGLGGREVAGDFLKRQYNRARKQMDEKP